MPLQIGGGPMPGLDLVKLIQDMQMQQQRQQQEADDQALRRASMMAPQVSGGTGYRNVASGNSSGASLQGPGGRGISGLTRDYGMQAKDALGQPTRAGLEVAAAVVGGYQPGEFGPPRTLVDRDEFGNPKKYWDDEMALRKDQELRREAQELELKRMRRQEAEENEPGGRLRKELEHIAKAAPDPMDRLRAITELQGMKNPGLMGPPAPPQPGDALDFYFKGAAADLEAQERKKAEAERIKATNAASVTNRQQINDLEQEFNKYTGALAAGAEASDYEPLARRAQEQLQEARRRQAMLDQGILPHEIAKQNEVGQGVARPEETASAQVHAGEPDAIAAAVRMGEGKTTAKGQKKTLDLVRGAKTAEEAERLAEDLLDPQFREAAASHIRSLKETKQEKQAKKDEEVLRASAGDLERTLGKGRRQDIFDIFEMEHKLRKAGASEDAVGATLRSLSPTYAETERVQADLDRLPDAEAADYLADEIAGMNAPTERIREDGRTQLDQDGNPVMTTAGKQRELEEKISDREMQRYLNAKLNVLMAGKLSPEMRKMWQMRDKVLELKKWPPSRFLEMDLANKRNRAEVASLGPRESGGSALSVRSGVEDIRREVKVEKLLAAYKQRDKDRAYDEERKILTKQLQERRKPAMIQVEEYEKVGPGQFRKKQ